MANPNNPTQPISTAQRAYDSTVTEGRRAAQKTNYPETINIRGARPTSGNPLVSRFLEPLIISVGQKLLIKRGFKRNTAEWDKFEADFKIKAIDMPYPAIQPSDRSWWFGTPVQDWVILSFDSYIDENGVSAPAGGIVLQNILLTINQPKIIERTRVPGKKGRVKQFIGEDDFEIQAIGKVIAPPEGYTGSYNTADGGKIYPEGQFDAGVRPQEEIMQLIRVLNAQVECDIYSPFLNLFNIDRIVVGPYSFPQEEGKLDNQLIKFTMWSDEEFDVTTGATEFV